VADANVVEEPWQITDDPVTDAGVEFTASVAVLKQPELM
jgi:hypothetical protein